MKAEYRKYQFDYVLLFYVLALLGLGTLMVASASYVKSSYLSETSDAYTIMTNQFIYAIIGIVAMVGASFVDYRIYKKLAVPIFIISLALMFITATPLGAEHNGARRWIDLGFIEFQPSELMKIALVLYIAAILSDDKLGKKSMGWFGLVTVLVPVGAVFASLAVQKHTSGIVIMGAIAVAMMFFGGIKMSIFATTLGVGAGAAVTMIAVFPHARQRVMTYLQSSFGNSSETLDTSGDGYQIQNSLRAIGSGGLFGRGYGKSIQKYLYLPESYNDFIFAIIAEELGFVGVVIVITLFVLLVCRGYKAAAYSSDKFASMVAAGISTIIGLQAVMNISVVSGVIPVTGVALPFFSYGGTSLIMIMGAMGILLNIAKQSEYIKF